ncbi:DMT family transporter [Arenibaculum pallidiluteum]|uniref:DMT family transporter n=1 Tax=Arenibaculum pallidiluteum TaxID=2812559 RepID=UPI001A95C137|nr:DMT family transporter [Arenibaculum pallidiluteum]
MTVSYLASLGAALCWAIGGLIAIGPVRTLGAFSFNRLRMVIVLVMLLAVTLALGTWRTLEAGHLLGLAASGIVGILVGDSLLFRGLQVIGPRRNAVVYATAAPMAALMSWLVLDELLGPAGLLGLLLCTGGVMVAVFFGRPSGDGHAVERLEGRLIGGVAFALAAAFCQAAGTILAKPVMAAGVDPIAASCVRVAVACAGLLVSGLLPGTSGLFCGVTPRLFGLVAVNGMLGMGIGMTLVLVALSDGNPGIVSTLSSTTPVLILPLLWAYTGRRPPLGGWIGAAVTVGGIALIFNR